MYSLAVARPRRISSPEFRYCTKRSPLQQDVSSLVPLTGIRHASRGEAIPAMNYRMDLCVDVDPPQSNQSAMQAYRHTSESVINARFQAYIAREGETTLIRDKVI
jgi:hypothetical protein